MIRSIPIIDNHLKKKSIRGKYKTELELINGVHQNSNTHPSIIHFSLNKSATQYVKSILSTCASKNGMVPVKIHDYAFNSDFPYLDSLSANEMKKYRHLFKEKGYLYSPFGGMIEGIQNLEKYKIVFVVRDPRDILVSNYFSIAYSHVAPQVAGDKLDTFHKLRMKAISTSIDDHVLLESDNLHKTCLRYHDLLLDKYSNTYVTTYEKMVAFFDEWLNDLILYTDLNVDQNVIQLLIDKNDKKKPKSEDKSKHVRKGRPGDYKEKLKKETIEQLNRKFAPILERYHYN
jgi:hypothetical protein